MTTTAEGICGVSVFPVINGATNDGRFKISNRTLGAAVPDPSSPITFPVDLNNTPNYLLNFGGSRSISTAPAASANQLLATFDIAPQPNATNASYTFGLDAFSELNTAAPGTNCFTNFSSEYISPTITLVRGTAPQFTSAAAATFTVTFPVTFTVTATGSPTPSLSISGAVPTGMTFTPATGLLTGTPILGTVETYHLVFTAANGNTPNATQNFTLGVQRANQAINFGGLADQVFSATPFALSASANSGLAVAFSSATADTCSVAASNVTMLATGTCTIIAGQVGDANYNAAVPISQSFAITGLGPHVVTPSAGANGSISPSTNQTINHGSATVFTVTPSVGYNASVGGTCGGSLVGTTYTTNAITANCTVTASFTLNTYTVTPSAGANGTISPSTPQTISHGSTTTFTVTPTAGYSAVMGGTCGGTLVGATYTTNVITGPCTVSATFSQITFTVTPTAGANGTISPSTPQTIAQGATTAFTVTQTAGYTASVGGTCGGSLVGATYTTNVITANCTVTASFTLNTYTVTPSAGANGSISPSTPQTIAQGATTAFTLTPSVGYTASVGGTCGGNLVGNTYTTSPITTNCTVDATFAPSLSLVSVVSRKMHGALGPYEVTLNPNLGIGDAIPVEPRSIGAGHVIVFTFNNPIVNEGSVTVVDASAAPVGITSLSRSDKEVRVTLTGIPDNRRVMISLAGVNGFASAAVPVGFLMGDVSGSRSVNASDISAVKAHLTQQTDGSNFRFDVNADGNINSTDLAAVKVRSGSLLP